MKRTIPLLLLALMITMAGSSSAFGGVTNAPIPTQSPGLKWSFKLEKSMTPPVIYESGGISDIYVASGQYVYRINKETGKVRKKSAILFGSLGYTTLPLTIKEGKVFVPLTKGKIEILDADTLNQLKVIDPKLAGGQNLTPVAYQKVSGKEHLYLGTWSGSGNGIFLCIDVDSGVPIWKQERLYGFYWAGAYVCNDYVVFGSEADAKNDATLYSFAPATDQLLATKTLAGSGDIRSTIVGDNHTLYVVSKGISKNAITGKGKLYKFEMNANGTFAGEPESCDLGGESTATPIIYDGKIYVSVKGKGIRILNKDTLADYYPGNSLVSTPGYIQGEMLLTTAYGSGTPYLYATCNNKQGGLFLLKDTGSGATGSTFFIPDTAMQQFCISGITCDAQGVLYYTTDAGYLMAVAKGHKISSTSSAGGSITPTRNVGEGGSYKFTATPGAGCYITDLTVDENSIGAKYAYTFTNVQESHSINATFKKLAKPAGLKATTGKSKISLKWSKNENATGYQIYRATKKTGKYTLIKTITTNKTTKFTDTKRTKGKTFYYKIRACKTVDNKKCYSTYSAIVNKKAK